MGTSINFLAALQRVEYVRLEDAITEARRTLAAAADDAQAIIESVRQPTQSILDQIPAMLAPLKDMRYPDLRETRRAIDDFTHSPDNPANWHRLAMARARAEPATQAIYARMRESLWQWREFAGVRRGARAVLETVIELAREEAFPWWLPVPAEDVRRLARLSEGGYARCVRELESLAVTRRGRLLQPCTDDGAALYAWDVGDADAVPRCEEEDHPQFVLRYRRGVPWNAKRAAWWINYDLLCATGIVQPMFVFSHESLPQTYGSRNRRMGPRIENVFDAHWRRSMSRNISKRGPLPEPGLRAPRWKLPGA